MKAIERLPGIRELALQFIPFGTEAELKQQLVAATLARTCLVEPLPGDAAAFEQRCREAKPRITLIAQEFMRLAGPGDRRACAVAQRARRPQDLSRGGGGYPGSGRGADAEGFSARLAVAAAGAFPRYLKAAVVRIDKLRNNPGRDAELMHDWKLLAQAWERETSPSSRPACASLRSRNSGGCSRNCA